MTAKKQPYRKFITKRDGNWGGMVWRQAGKRTARGRKPGDWDRVIIRHAITIESDVVIGSGK